MNRFVSWSLILIIPAHRQRARNYCAVEELASMELTADRGWLNMLVKQLEIRDSLLAEMNEKIGTLRHRGMGLEMDLDYLHLKVSFETFTPTKDLILFLKIKIFLRLKFWHI